MELGVEVRRSLLVFKEGDHRGHFVTTVRFWGPLMGTKPKPVSIQMGANILDKGSTITCRKSWNFWLRSVNRQL